MATKRRMREAFGITGFVPDAIAKRIHETRDETNVVEVSVERGSADVVMRVRMENVADVRLGASEGGETAVQLIFTEDHEVETVIRQRTTVDGMLRFHDPAIGRLTAKAASSVIFVG